MRLERLNGDKIKIFLTFDDLKERGITKDDMWKDLPKVQQLFRDMILEADDELGFHADGPIEVEVFSLPAQGMVVIVSKAIDYTDFDDEDDDDDYIEMQVTLDESHHILYKFSDLEDIIALAGRLVPLGVTSGTLYSYENLFYLCFNEEEIEIDIDMFIALLAEFGNTSTMTSYRLCEYGNCLIEKDALDQLDRFFLQPKTSQ